MEASSLIEGYFVGSADRTERLLSCLEFCAVSASEYGSVEDALEKGTFYRGMFASSFAGADVRLSSQVDTLLDKFSELRLKLLSIPVAIDVSRATIIEANQAWAGLMRRLGKISNRGGVAMHAICNVGDDLVVTSFHPSSIRGSPIRQSLLHVGSDVALYDDSSPRGLSIMLDSLLVARPDSEAGFRVRTCDDKITTSPTTSLSASQGPLFSNDESSILSSPSSPIEFTAVLLIDSESIQALADISSLDQSEVDEFVENVVTLTTEAVRELRKDEKLASIKSMRQLVSTIEALIKLEEATDSVQNSLSRDRGKSTCTGTEARPPSVYASLEKSFGHVFSVANETATATAVTGNGGVESPLPPPKQKERPERKSSSSPVKLLGASENSAASSSPAKKSNSPSTKWKSRRYQGTANSSEEDDDDKPRTGESINGPLNFSSRTDLSAVDALGESWGQYALKSVVEGSEALSYEDPKSAPSSPLAPAPTPVPSPVPASSPVSAAKVAKAVMFEGNSPAKPHSVAAVLAAPPLRWELESRESEDMESFGLRAYHAIRDDILGDVVSRLRDSTLQLSPTRASLALSQSKDVGSDRPFGAQYSPHPQQQQQYKAESKSPQARSPANEFKRKFKAAERAVSSRQSDAYAESKFGAAMAAAAEAVAASRPGTAPAAAKYSDGSGRVALPKPKGKTRASSKGLNTSMDSFRSSVSSLSSMGSPPRPGPASPLRSGGRGSPSLSMSMTSTADRPAMGQSRDRPSTGTRRVADARIPSPTKRAASTPLTFSQQRLRTPDASEAFRPNTAASAASRDCGARRGMGYLDVGAYHSPSPSPSGSASFSPNGRFKAQGEGKSPSPLRASIGSSKGGSPPKLESELVIEGWYDEQQEQREVEEEEQGEEQEQEVDNDPWPRRWETGPSVLPLPLCMEIPRVRASQDDDLYDEEGDIQGQEQEEDQDQDQEQEKHEVEGGEADERMYDQDREPEQPELEDEDGDGLSQAGIDYHRAKDEFYDDYETAEAKAQAEAEAEEVQFVAKSPVSRRACANPASSPPRITLRSSRELPSLDEVPVSVFSTSAIDSLKAQLELSRAEIESTRQQKEREVDEARKNTAWHVLRALEGKTVAPSVTFHPAPASPARRGVVIESPTKAVVAQTSATEQPRDEVEAYAIGVSLEAQAHEQRRVRFAQQQRSREANVLTQQVLAQAQARDVQQQQRQQQQQHQTAPPASQFRARAMANKLSNQQQIKNAICNVCLAGVHHEAQRAEALAAIDYWHLGEGAEARKRELRGAVDTSAPAPAVAQFLVLFFHSKSLSFRGLYAVDPYTGDISKIYGRGPRTLPTACIEDYFKYESSSRSFKKLSVASISPTVDAVAVDPSKFKKGML